MYKEAIHQKNWIESIGTLPLEETVEVMLRWWWSEGGREHSVVCLAGELFLSRGCSDDAEESLEIIVRSFCQMMWMVVAALLQKECCLPYSMMLRVRSKLDILLVDSSDLGRNLKIRSIKSLKIVWTFDLTKKTPFVPVARFSCHVVVFTEKVNGHPPF